MSKDVYAITHTDLDGIGCAILLKKAYPKIKIYMTEYNDLTEVMTYVLQEMKEDDRLFITDISLNPMQAKLCENIKIQHIDHHSSSKSLMDKYSWSFTDITHCATYHLYNILSVSMILSDYKEFVDLVDNYDTWGFGTQPSEEAKDLNRLYHMIGAEAMSARFDISGSVKMTKGEEAIVATDKYQEEKYIKECCKKVAESEDLNHNKFIFLAAERYTNALGSELLKRYLEAEYVIILDTLHDKASLRSRGKVDVGELAKSCGGGGHKKAAGFITNDSALRSFWRCAECPWNPERSRHTQQSTKE